MASTPDLSGLVEIAYAGFGTYKLHLSAGSYSLLLTDIDPSGAPSDGGSSGSSEDSFFPTIPSDASAVAAGEFVQFVVVEPPAVPPPPPFPPAPPFLGVYSVVLALRGLPTYSSTATPAAITRTLSAVMSVRSTARSAASRASCAALMLSDCVRFSAKRPEIPRMRFSYQSL